MAKVEGALLRLINRLNEIPDDPLSLDEYQQTLAGIKSSRGKSIRRLIYDIFRRFFNGATSQLEWADTYRSLTL